MPSKLSALLNHKISLPKRAPGAPQTDWIFIGWMFTGAMSLLIIGYVVFFLNIQVYQTLKNADVIFTLRERTVYTQFNFPLFEHVRARWQAKKALTLPRDMNDPFF